MQEKGITGQAGMTVRKLPAPCEGEAPG